MKKQLLGTTTLVAAGLLMGQGAYAAEPMSVTIGGYVQSAYSYADDGKGTAPAAHNSTISTEGELQLTATTELDNGLSVRARIEYEGHNQGNGTAIVDERYIRFSGGFGQFQIGQDDSASYSMHYSAPQGSWNMGINSPTFALPLDGTNAITSYTSLWPFSGGDGGKVIYFTPRFNGFQLGASYQPDGANEPAGGAPAARGGIAAGGQSDQISIGANYVSSFDEVDVAISFGYIRADSEGQTALGLAEDRDIFHTGLNLSFAGFTVGGSYRHNDQGLNGSSFEGFDIGATYVTGPWTLGVTYLHAEQELGVGLGDDDVDAWNVSGTYNVGAGVDLWGGVKLYDFDTDTGLASANNTSVHFVLGTSIWF